MNSVPRTGNTLGVSRIRLHDIPESPGRGRVQKGASVQFNATDIFIANPDVYVRRLEAVLPGIDNESELALYCNGGHIESQDKVMPLTPAAIKDKCII